MSGNWYDLPPPTEAQKQASEDYRRENRGGAITFAVIFTSWFFGLIALVSLIEPLGLPVWLFCLIVVLGQMWGPLALMCLAILIVEIRNKLKGGRHET